MAVGVPIMFLLLLVAGGLALCMVVGLILIAAGDQARPVGKVLLAIPLCLVLAGVLAGAVLTGYFRIHSVESETRVRAQAQQAKIGAQLSEDLDKFSVALSPEDLGVPSPEGKAGVDKARVPPPGPESRPPKAKSTAAAVAEALRGAARPAAAKKPPAGGSPAAAAKPRPEPFDRREPAEHRDASTPAAAKPSPPPAAKPPVVAEKPAAGPKELPSSPRPEWLDRPARVSEGVYEVVVTAGPWDTRADCDASLPDAVERGVQQFITQYLGEEAAGRISLPVDYVNAEILKEKYPETVDSPSFGRMTRLHALLQFDREVKDRVRDDWARVQREQRLVYAGGGLGGLLLLLSVVYGYLKLDLATKGAYRGRLRVLSAAMIFGLSTAAWVLLMRGGR